MIKKYFEENIEIRFNIPFIKISKHKLIDAVLILRDSLGFKQLVDIICIDNYGKNEKSEARFRMIYLFSNLKKHERAGIEIFADEEWVPSLYRFFPNSNWHEREIFDMFGISFDGHPDLRRILTDYMFEGYPLRKDFPLTGHYEAKYDEKIKKVIYQKVALEQEFTDFKTESRWVGLPNDYALQGYSLPGDDKVKKIDENR